jgi:Ca2+-binding EF-hand superfamily protein
MERFLVQQSNGQVDSQLALDIYREIDIDKNNQISIEEFVYAYYKKQREIKDRIASLSGDLVAH